jgi:hypothetical protein
MPHTDRHGRRFTFFPFMVGMCLEMSFRISEAAEIGVDRMSREYWYQHGQCGKRALASFGLGPWPPDPLAQRRSTSQKHLESILVLP